MLVRLKLVKKMKTCRMPMKVLDQLQLIVLRKVLKLTLTPDEYKLYSIIYYKTLSSLMADAKVESTTVILDNNDYKFKTTGSILTFDGYLKVYAKYEEQEDIILPDVTRRRNLIVSDDVLKTQHFTKPAPRYTESKFN